MYILNNCIFIFYEYNKKFRYTKNKIKLTENLITDFNNIFYNNKIKQL